jgi:ADP-ribosylglycohydrolase
MAGAAGDALGYTVEFWSKQQIVSKYGAQGITQFELDSNGKALISDDTQMTLFTANGLLMGVTRWNMRGIGAELGTYTDGAYLDWYYTQTGKKPDFSLTPDFHYTWLRDLPELAHRRAPGNTCLNACESMLHREKPNNNSKGCGGIMRVAPMGLFEASFEEHFDRPLYADVWLAEQGAVIARMTHLHPLGYYPAALMTLLIAKLVPLTPEEAQRDIKRIVKKSLDVLKQLDEGAHEEDKKALADLTKKVLQLAHDKSVSDAEAIELLGEGWVAEEAWAVSLFCALRHIDSMRDAIIAAVNHNGDSDSTGAITGNIMGAIYGYEAIKRERLFCPEGKEFETTIELAPIIMALADDLYTGCCIGEYSPINTPEQKQWYARYVEMKPAGF